MDTGNTQYHHVTHKISSNLSIPVTETERIEPEPPHAGKYMLIFHVNYLDDSLSRAWFKMKSAYPQVSSVIFSICA